MSAISLDFLIEFGDVTVPMKSVHSLYITEDNGTYQIFLRLNNVLPAERPLVCFSDHDKNIVSRVMKNYKETYNNYLSQIKTTNGGSCSSNKTN